MSQARMQGGEVAVGGKWVAMGLLAGATWLALAAGSSGGGESGNTQTGTCGDASTCNQATITVFTTGDPAAFSTLVARTGGTGGTGSTVNNTGASGVACTFGGTVDISGTYTDNARGFDGPHDDYEEVDKRQGRIEIRRTWATPAVEGFEDRSQWTGLKSFAAVECERTANGETTTGRRSFISRLDGSDVQAIARAVRDHWSVENNLHGSLGRAFNEDRSRIRNGQGADNVSRPRRTALNRRTHEKTAQLGIKNERLRAGWNEQYLCPVLRI